MYIYLLVYIVSWNMPCSH